MQTLWQDLRYGARMLKKPGHTLMSQSFRQWRLLQWRRLPVRLAIFVLFIAALPALAGRDQSREGVLRSGAASARSGMAQGQRVNHKSQPVRVFYRWRVKPQQEGSFAQAWTQTARRLRNEFKGAQGSLLLRDRQTPSEFAVFERWESQAAWLAFQQRKSPVASSARPLPGELLSTEVFDEVGDLLDYSDWKGKMIRVYRIGVKAGAESDFEDAWRKAARAITAKHKGARGSLLLRDPKKPSSFVEVVRWDSLADWQAFIAAEPAAPEAFRTIFAVMTVVATNVFDEVEHLSASVQRASPARVRSGYVTVADGARIHYLEAGARNLPPAAQRQSEPAVLFVPGWMMPAEIWEAQLNYFGARRRAVALAPRAQGKSSKPADGHFPAMRASDIRVVVDQLKLAPVVLIGASMGVTDLAAYVDQFGTNGVAGFALIHGVPGADYDPSATPQLLQWAAEFQKNRRQQTAALVRSLFCQPPDEAYLKRLTEAALLMPTNSAIASFFGAFTADYRPALSKIDKPTLIVVARNNWLSHYEDMRRRIKGSQLEVFDHTGHALFIEAAGRFNSLLDEFLTGLR
jgi:microsomal epoxide hydrolase